MKYWLPVAIGGAFGSLGRYALSGWISERTSQLPGWWGVFPWGTLGVNLLGCGLIGLLVTLWSERLVVDPWWRSFLGIGILGGFTTFSTFGLETWSLWASGSRWLALGNACGSVLFGFLGVVVGASLARAVA